MGYKQIQPVNERYIDRIQKLECGIGKLKYRNYPPNTLHHFVDDTDGIHSIGGEPPKEFLILESNWSIQYFGKISSQDSVFQWLPFDLHIVYPHYYEIDWVFLDYSNPLSPIILNREEFENEKPILDSITKNSKVVFKEKRFKTVLPTNNIYQEWGNTGFPMWIQSPNIPYCPISGKMMKFVCQFPSYIRLEIQELGCQIKKEDQHYFEGMNSLDIDLYIFFEPETKTACFITQYS